MPDNAMLFVDVRRNWCLFIQSSRRRVRCQARVSRSLLMLFAAQSASCHSIAARLPSGLLGPAARCPDNFGLLDGSSAESQLSCLLPSCSVYFRFVINEAAFDWRTQTNSFRRLRPVVVLYSLLAASADVSLAVVSVGLGATAGSPLCRPTTAKHTVGQNLSANGGCATAEECRSMFDHLLCVSSRFSWLAANATVNFDWLRCVT